MVSLHFILKFLIKIEYLILVYRAEYCSTVFVNNCIFTLINLAIEFSLTSESTLSNLLSNVLTKLLVEITSRGYSNVQLDTKCVVEKPSCAVENYILCSNF